MVIMKKMLAICSVAVMLLLNAGSVLAEKSGESYFTDDFESQTDWVSLAGAGWQSSNGGGVSISDGKDGKCACINAYWGSSLNAPVPETASGIVGVSFDMMMEKRNVDGVYIQMTDESAESPCLLKFEWRNEAYAIFAYGADIYNTAPIFTLQQNQWINVKMLLDLKNNKYSAWITDEEGTSTNIIADLSAPVSGIGSIVFLNPQYGMYGVPEEDVGEFKLDNFDMYKDIPDESEDFENVSYISEVQRWTSSNNNGVAIVSEENNKYLQINSLWENLVSKRFYEPCSSNIILEMKLKAEQAKGQFLRVLTGEGDNDYKNFLCINQDEEGNNQIIYCYGENVWNIASVAFENNTWFNLKIIVNKDKNVWYGYINLDPANDGEEQLIFWDSIADIDKLYGLQIFYPMHWVADDPSAEGKNFCIDDFKTAFFDGELSYSLNTSVTAKDGTTITDKQTLLGAKDQSPAVNVTVTRTTYGEMLPAYAVAAVYQDGKLVSLNMNNEFKLSGMNKEKIIVLNPDFSKLSTESENIEIKVFLWQRDNLMPLTSAAYIWGE